MYDARVDFWEKWREFLEGGNDIWVFLKNGKHPCLADGRADGLADGRADGRFE